MSEQNQSNIQAFGAGLLGFVAVMAIGGGALVVRSSQQAKAGAKPVAAAEPIDLGSSMPRPPLSQASAHRERRAESPAPLMGAQDEAEGSEAPAEASDGGAGAAASSPKSAPNGKARASRLEVTQHLDKPGRGSSATAVVRNTNDPEKSAEAAEAADRKAAPKLVATGGGAIASVHYGVTSRSELMGRAAGPVYNIKGGSGKVASGAAGSAVGDMGVRIADLQRQLEAAGLPADQRAKLQKDLDGAMKGVASPEKTAQ